MAQTSTFPEALTVEQAEPSLPFGSGTRIEYFEPHWYAAYTCANHEKSVARQLERRSMQCFLPLYESVRRWKDRRVRLELPLFPGYVFVQLALRDRLRVLEVPGLVRLVGFDGHPSPLPTEDIETIRTCLGRRRFMAPHPYVRRGQRVRLLRGPLEGLTGVVLRQKNRTRFVISLELLMRSVAVEIDSADFDPHAAPQT
jgi:transcription termination/antitermination protein NusG